MVDTFVKAISGTVETSNKIATSSSDVLNAYLIDALTKTGNTIDKSVDMVMEQTPALVSETLHWYFTYNLMLCIASIIIIIFAYIGLRKVNMMFDEFADKSMVLFTISLCASIAFAFTFNIQWLKIYIAPRLWLIEYTMHLMKSTTH